MTQSTVQDATVFALVYGLPLASYANLASQVAKSLNVDFATNTFYHQPKLASAGFSVINRPNVDTLYSEAVVDLSSSNLVVTIPDVPEGRFYVFPFYDLYGDNFANLGTATKSKSGRYLVSYRPADPGHRPGDASYAGYIYMPTPYGAIDLRIQVNGEDDVTAVNALQVQFELTTSPSSQPQSAPTLTRSLLLEGFSGDDTTKLLQLTARLSQFSPPEVKADSTWVTATLQIAGLAQGSYSTPSGVDLPAAAKEVLKLVSNVRKEQSSKYFADLGNSWSYLRAQYSGDFKSHYLVRAFVAAEGYLQLKAEQAIYPVYSVSTDLRSGTSYKITFNGKPPVDGFWSLTVYDAGSYLVANQWDKYSLGDRSYSMTYDNGDLVYGPNGSPAGSTQEFSILLQTQDTAPPNKYIANWLPTPSGNQIFNFNLRWYGPTVKLMTSYVYPVVTEIPLVTESSPAF